MGAGPAEKNMLRTDKKPRVRLSAAAGYMRKTFKPYLFFFFLPFFFDEHPHELHICAPPVLRRA
jgi:hypothetical protein